MLEEEFLKDSAHRWNARKLIHFVDIEAIFPFSGYKCKYLVRIEGYSLLAKSNKRCTGDLDSISLPRSTLLCHYLENIVYSTLPQWLSQSTLLCLKEWLQLSVKEDLCILPASKVQPSNSPSCYCKSLSCNLSATIDGCNNHALIRLLGSAATQKRVVAVAVQALLSHNWLAKKKFGRQLLK